MNMSKLSLFLIFSSLFMFLPQMSFAFPGCGAYGECGTFNPYNTNNIYRQNTYMALNRWALESEIEKELNSLNDEELKKAFYAGKESANPVQEENLKEVGKILFGPHNEEATETTKTKINHWSQI